MNTNSEPSSLTAVPPSSQPMQPTLFQAPTPSEPGQLVFEIEVDGRLRSWNDILGMEQWARYEFKKELADVFLSALRRYGRDSSTKTIFARSTMSIFADTLESYLTMLQAKRKLRSDKKRRSRAEENLFASKSSKSKPPF